MMSEITKKAPRSEPDASTVAAGVGPRAAMPRAAGGFWSFMKTFFVGTAGLALLAVITTLAGSAWLTANQRAEAEKAEPWTNPSFTTTAVTTGGMLARWMDNDGNIENGHSYIKGIYDLWKIGAGSKSWQQAILNPIVQKKLPQLWQLEASKDITHQAGIEEAAIKLTAAKTRLIAEQAIYENKRSNFGVFDRVSIFPNENGIILAKGIARRMGIAESHARFSYDIQDKIEAQVIKYAFRVKRDLGLNKSEFAAFAGSPEETNLKNQLDEVDYIKFQTASLKLVRDWDRKPPLTDDSKQ